MFHHKIVPQWNYITDNDCLSTGLSFGFCLYLVVYLYLTPFPSPARTILNEREFFLAGEGSKEERGRHRTVSIPVLDYRGNGQPLQERIDIEYRFKALPP
jgi:hypothetical protein